MCGIEYGGTENPNSFAFNDVSEPPFISDEERRKVLREQYNVKVAKLYAALRGDPLDKYHEIAMEQHLFGPSSDFFKMNLYPIGFRSDGDELWEQWIYNKTGLPTKSLYRAWCQLNRFPRFRDRMRESTPRLIIGTGSSYRDDFMIAFSGVEELFSKELTDEKVLDRRILWTLINGDETILAITPFLGGRYGLNSDELIKECGRILNSICSEKFGKHWMMQA